MDARRVNPQSHNWQWHLSDTPSHPGWNGLRGRRALHLGPWSSSLHVRSLRLARVRTLDATKKGSRRGQTSWSAEIRRREELSGVHVSKHKAEIDAHTYDLLLLDHVRKYAGAGISIHVLGTC